MKKVLVLGGTRFFGKRLVEQLINANYDVTIATRGLTKDDFGEKVKRIVFNRDNPNSMEQLAQQSWDVVYDNICYSPNEAKEIVNVLKGKVGRFVFTSTLAVYEECKNVIEDRFNPYTYPIQYGNREDYTYAEGKKLAEAILFQQADFPVVAVRFPVVIGENDYTERLLFHVKKIWNHQELVIKNLENEMTFITEEEAGEFLNWLSTNDVTGPINACSNDVITFNELIQICEEELGIKANIVDQGEKENQSPYDTYSHTYLSNQLAKDLGFKFSNVKDEIKKLIHSYQKNLVKK
ncbi:NAD-dependent epimerase/dehydratase family protein [Bacillus sp. RG28]|uniref:UDP-glucose 4-epimerase n=1 Tax=Gottfriedia endophytica TaxID=2820819 RepID=A0A940SLA7_9BACI|nr:NAD-dependent epimerase/dehydratase family protein [Gottfriedia endophytica]MBP0726919.1 NAD-dependent epimerase/dehydratase family protein [Gottfriedia endophytica]